MKSKLLTKIIFISFLLLLIGGVLPLYVHAQEEDSNVVEQPADESSTEEKALLFVEEGCPYCRKVEEFITDKSLDTKVDIRDIRKDPANAALYNQKFDEAQVPLEQRGGVPVLFDGSQYFSGADEIIRYLGTKYQVPYEDYLSDSEEANNDGDDSHSNRVVFGILAIGLLVAGGVIVLSNKRGR